MHIHINRATPRLKLTDMFVATEYFTSVRKNTAQDGTMEPETKLTKGSYIIL